MPQGFVYIVGSNTGTLYIGVTSKLGERILQHKSGEGSQFTSAYGCNRLLYFKRFGDIRDAISREKSLKGKTRAKKIDLIKSTNADLRDLAVRWGWLRIGQQPSIAEVEAWLDQYPAMDPQQKPGSEAESRQPLRQGKLK